MAYQAIGLGSTADDGTGDTLRVGGDKANDNFVELYTLLGTGTALSSGISASATVVTLAAPTITGVVGGTQTSATITTLATTTVNATTLNGAIGTAAQTNITSLGTLTALVVDDVSINGKVMVMTGDTDDTVTFTTAANGTLSIVTVDDAAAAANIQITADGTVDIDSAGVLTLDSGAAINIEPASGSAILLDGTISVDAGVVTGATSITSTAFAGALSGTLGAFLDTNDKFVSFSQGANIASVAGDTDIWANYDGNAVHITGTNAITDFGTPKQAGDSMWVIFDAAASVVDSATITIAGNTNFQAAANDLALVYALSTSTFLFMPFKNSGLPPVYDADTLKADTDDVLTGGFGGTDDDDGTKSSGTYTPTYAGGNFKLAVNGGAHTLAPQSGTGTIIIQYTNNAAAGTITTSGWTVVTGDSLTTTDGDDFMFYLTVVAAFKHLHVVALQ